MHIPDGFLSPSVWATLDVAAIPAVAWAARQAQSDLEGPPLEPIAYGSGAHFGKSR